MEPPAQTARSGKWRSILTRWPTAYGMLLGAAGLVGWNLRAAPGSTPLLSPGSTPRAVLERSALDADERRTIGLFGDAVRCVAAIRCFVEAPPPDLEPGEAEFATGEVAARSGSGVVWDRDGAVVTNLHVVRGCEHIVVTLADGTSWRARRVGVDERRDLAVLRIDAEPDRLHPIPVGRSVDLRVGQTVFAIGHPFGLDATFTTGIVSGLGRELVAPEGVSSLFEMIQTDATIHPGSSGGPLLDSAGRLVGINTAVAPHSGSGFGFAIPVDRINEAVPELLATGRLCQPGFGIQLLTDDQNHRFCRSHELSGVFVLAVQPGSAADEAGVEPTRWYEGTGRAAVRGDVVLAIDGTRVKTPHQLRRQMLGRSVGEYVELTLARYGGSEPEVVRLSIELRDLTPPVGP